MESLNIFNDFSLLKKMDSDYKMIDILKIKEYIENGDENLKGDRKNTSLIYASLDGNIEVVKYLVEKEGADVEAHWYGDTPLIFAFMHGHIEVVKYLVEQGGANIEARNNLGNTPLIIASIYGNIEVVKYLVEQGADVEVRKNNGKLFTDLLPEYERKKVEEIIEDLQKRKAMIKPCRSN